MPNMPTILVTGATGAVMEPACILLLERGYRVVALVRSTDGMPPRERLEKLFHVDGAAQHLFVIQGDITELLAKVSQKDIEEWYGKIDIILHGAASVKFEEGPDREVQRANVYGTQQMLLLAEKLGAKEFHYVSTAYVAGDREEFAEDDPYGFPRNIYESSKIDAEQEVRKSSIPFSILRIPIVVGDSQTGEISHYTGYYSFLAAFWRIRMMAIRRAARGIALPDGMWLDTEQNLHIPVSVPCSEDKPANLVPINWLVEQMVTAIGIPAAGHTFHLVHENPPGIREIMDMSLRAIGIHEVRYGGKPKPQEGALGRIQSSILREIGHYEPYLCRGQRFSTNATRAKFKEHGLQWTPAPRFTPELVSILLNYATAHSFGKQAELVLA